MSSRLSWSSSSSRVIPAAPCLDGLVLNSSIPTRASVSPVEKCVIYLPGFPAVCWGSPGAAALHGGFAPCCRSGWSQGSRMLSPCSGRWARLFLPLLCCYYCITRPQGITLEKLELVVAPIPAISCFLFLRNATLNADRLLQAHVELGCLENISIGSFIPGKEFQNQLKTLKLKKLLYLDELVEQSPAPPVSS